MEITYKGIKLNLTDEQVKKCFSTVVDYANPEFYHAIMIVGDSPCGGFASDFDDKHANDFYDREMPGKIAREALAEIANANNIDFTEILEANYYDE